MRPPDAQQQAIAFDDPRLPARFWSKTRPPADLFDCWEWLGARDRSGYGILFWDGQSRGAYRVAYETLVASVGVGLQIDHVCRVRACVNPAHLRTLTSRENTLCGLTIPAAHAQQTHCIRGHQAWVISGGRRQCRECNRLEALRAKRWKKRYQEDPEYRAHTLARNRAARRRRAEREQM